MFIIENLIHFLLYFINCIVIYNSYYLLDLLFIKYKSYKSIEPQHKKVYFISNIIKGSVLGLFSPIAYLILHNYFLNNYWNIGLIKFFANIYTSLDLVSIFKVEKMQKNTIIHHIMVQILYLYSLVICDFNETTIAKPIVIYAIFSTFAFVVNLYLSFRLVLNDTYLKYIATLSAFLYQFYCTLNWIYQIYYLNTENIEILYKIIYTLIILSIVNDDIVLIKFLNKNSF